MPPTYVAEAPTFATSAAVKAPYKVDRYTGLGRDSRSNEEGSIAAQLECPKRAFRNMQVSRGTKSLDYDNLCIHPDINIASGVQTTKL